MPAKDYLLPINEWLRKRHASGEETKTLSDLQQEFIHNVITDLFEDAFQGEDQGSAIITVRSSFRQKSLFLRPVYSSPASLTEFMQNSDNQKPFSLEKKQAFNSMPSKNYRIFEVPEKPFSFAATYKLGSIPNPHPNSFPKRIDSLHTHLQSNGNIGHQSKSVSICYFAGRNKDGVGADVVELRHLFAVLLKSSTEPTLNGLEKLHNHCQSLFDGLDLISSIDASLFESDGLGLVADLLPYFSQQEVDVAPADKIAYALERMKQLLGKRMIGSHGGRTAPQMFYIATTFERKREHMDGKGEQKTLMPRLEVYPHIYRNEHLTASYFVTHRQIPSATKFLIWRYLHSEHRCIVETTSSSSGTNKGVPPIQLSQTFDQMFSADRLGTPPVEKWVEKVAPSDKPDFLHLSRGDDDSDHLKGVWLALNRPATEKCRSIAAFVVEGRIVGMETCDIPRHCLPRGVFAIESEYEDGFSDADIESLRKVFHGLASLIRLISHQHAPIDYRSLIAATFDEDLQLNFTERPLGQKLLFLVQKLDGRSLSELLKQCESALLCDLAPNCFRVNRQVVEILKKIVEICPGEDDADAATHDKRAAVLRQRMSEMQKLLRRSDPEQARLMISNEVLEFLEACPENFTWASYLSCMAQTLGDRVDAEGDLPQFTRMLPGFSASGMFMAIVDGELRQVVKLSTAAKLRKESMLYRKWVRYRLVNAARIPNNGFAFETTGIEGQYKGQGRALEKNKTPESDGVLVSDLVSGGRTGEERVRTLLDIVAIDLGGDSETKKSWPKLADVSIELDAVFDKNSMLWNKAVARFNEQPYINSVFDAFRVPIAPGDERKPQFDMDMSRAAKILNPNGNRFDFRDMLDRCPRVVLLATELEGCRAISHGDMNARNLTWAEELKSFFLIDFEHVGPSLKGIDQFRLAVNLTAELRQGWSAVKPPIGSQGSKQIQGLQRILNQVDIGCSFLISLFSNFIEDGGPATLSKMIENARRASKATKASLAGILQSIVLTVDKDPNHNTKHWRFHWALLLLSSITKEFSYSCRNTDERHVEEILRGREPADMKAAEIDAAIDEFASKGRITPMQKFPLFRHLIAARMLSGLYKELPVKQP